MSYSSILVNLRLGRDNGRVLAVVADLAARFHAHVTGIALWQPIEIAYSDTYLAPELVNQDRARRLQESEAAEAEFRAALRNTPISWHAVETTGILVREMANRARSADLLVTGAGRDAAVIELSRPLHLGDLVMEAGRPVLVVPEPVERLSFGHVLVAWKDGREARRAAAAALPLLKTAGQVSITEIAPASAQDAVRRRLDDLGTWLARHGVQAKLLPVEADGDDAHRLNLLAVEQKVDLIVAGAYAHNRLREWMLGGVTHDLLLRSNLCSLVTH